MVRRDTYRVIQTSLVILCVEAELAIGRDGHSNTNTKFINLPDDKGSYENLPLDFEFETQSFIVVNFKIFPARQACNSTIYVRKSVKMTTGRARYSDGEVVGVDNQKRHSRKILGEGWCRGRAEEMYVRQGMTGLDGQSGCTGGRKAVDEG